MPTRGIRGATTVVEDQIDQIHTATQELLSRILEENPTLKTEDICSAHFTVTHDLLSAFPAEAARQIGWTSVPLMCSQEISVDGSLNRCIRVLILWNTELPQNEIHHIYLREASELRPDIISPIN